MNHPDFIVETKYKDDVLDYIKATIPTLSSEKNELNEKLSAALANYNYDNPEMSNELTVNMTLLNASTGLLSAMERGQKNPYFARVDFTPEKETLSSLYIGKFTLMRENQVLIIDWRAPVSTLYYEGRLGKAEYTCPEGLIQGEISLKRLYKIEDGEILDITDIDITANDTFLQAALGASKDRRLNDIVTTIQAEQNQIIRAPLSKSIIVQGAAGSGKTTIALHRIAYLLYNYEKSITAGQIVIMAPNHFFLSYISDVLPDLGVEHVTQTTFEDFAKEILDYKKKILTTQEILADGLNKNELTDMMKISGLKSGFNFQKVVEGYCIKIEQDCLPTTDFEIEGYKIFDLNEIKHMFLVTFSYLPIAKRAVQIKKYLNVAMKKMIPKIIEKIESDFDRRMRRVKETYPEDCLERRELAKAIHAEESEIVGNLKKKSSNELKKYMKAFEVKSAADLYHDLFSIPELLESLSEDIFSKTEVNLIRTPTKFLTTEDLPPLLWITTRVFGTESDTKHIVIDEAQDASFFQISALKLMMPRATFSIMGDLHQGIYSFKGISDWSYLTDLINADVLKLKQSYRTTIEIMDESNKIIMKLYDNKQAAVPLAEPVIRHGKPVEKKTAANAADLYKDISDKIKELKTEGFRSIAVIGKTKTECSELNKALKLKDVSVITEQDFEYEGGIIIIPSYLVKGLEFDAVIIAKATSYSDNSLDVKLLYIAMTRALHNLTVCTLAKK